MCRTKEIFMITICYDLFYRISIMDFYKLYRISYKTTYTFKFNKFLIPTKLSINNQMFYMYSLNTLFRNYRDPGYTTRNKNYKKVFTFVSFPSNIMTMESLFDIRYSFTIHYTISNWLLMTLSFSIDHLLEFSHVCC